MEPLLNNLHRGGSNTNTAPPTNHQNDSPSTTKNVGTGIDPQHHDSLPIDHPLDDASFDRSGSVTYVSKSLIKETTSRSVKLDHIGSLQVFNYQNVNQSTSPRAGDKPANSGSEFTPELKKKTHKWCVSIKNHVHRLATVWLKDKYVKEGQRRGLTKIGSVGRSIASFQDFKDAIEKKDFETQFNIKYRSKFEKKGWGKGAEEIIMEQAKIKYRDETLGGARKAWCEKVVSTALIDLRSSFANKVRRRTPQERDENGKPKKRKHKHAMRYVKKINLVAIDDNNVDGSVLVGSDSHEEDVADTEATAARQLRKAMSGSGAPTDNNISKRLDALESRLNSQDAKLDAILAAIRGE